MVLRVLGGLSLATIHAAFRYSEFELLSLSNNGDLTSVAEEVQLAAAKDHEDVEEQRHLVEEFASLRLGLTAVHPEPNPQQWPPPEGPNRERPSVNCLRMLFTDLFQDPERLLEDCIMLANRVQRHKCDKKYCLKSVPVAPNVTVCKFHFPLPLEGFEEVLLGVTLAEVVNRMLELMHQGAKFSTKKLRVMRNHPRLVETIQELMQGWRANSNVRIVESLQQLLQYVLKYMLKPTSGSASFENTVRDILAQQSLNSKPASACQRVLMRQITEHDMPRTEAARIVSGRPFVFYSRPFRMVNLMGVRGLVMPHEEQGGEVGEQPEAIKATRDNFADIYWGRESCKKFLELVRAYEEGDITLPWHPREVSLYGFAAHFEKNWTPAARTYVPHISPTFR
jgi:hypothetical protein